MTLFTAFDDTPPPLGTYYWARKWINIYPYKKTIKLTNIMYILTTKLILTSLICFVICIYSNMMGAYFLLLVLPLISAMSPPKMLAALVIL